MPFDAGSPEKVLDAVMALPDARREHLRSLVDWLEAYEREEQAAGRTFGMPKAASAKRR